MKTVSKVTTAFLKVLGYFLEDPNRPVAGIEIVKSTKLHSGTVYPILNRMEETGWLRGEYEDIDPSIEGRPRRRFYYVTENGLIHGRRLLAEFIPDIDAYYEWKTRQRDGSPPRGPGEHFPAGGLVSTT